LLAAIVTLVACNGETTDTTTTVEKSVKDTVPTKNDPHAKFKKKHSSVFYTKYKLPLPVELYLALKEEDIPFNKDILTDPKSVDKAVTSVSKAMNLGFYSSDLAYCTVFDQNKDAADFFEVTKRLSEDLKINVGYTQETVDRFHRNINNSDSLYEIASQNYWKTCDFLEETQHINVLPFIIVGSWVESMHLSIHAIEKAPSNEVSIMNRVAAQRAPLGQLIEYLYKTLVDIKVFKINQDIQRIVKELMELQVIYEQLDQNEEGVVITKKQFEQIAEKVAKIRVDYINMK
jgi:hypothetical protein